MEKTKKIKAILLKLDEELHDEFAELCKDTGYTKSGWIRVQIIKKLKEMKQDEQ